MFTNSIKNSLFITSILLFEIDTGREASYIPSVGAEVGPSLLSPLSACGSLCFAENKCKSFQVLPLSTASGDSCCVLFDRFGCDPGSPPLRGDVSASVSSSETLATYSTTT